MSRLDPDPGPTTRNPKTFIIGARLTQDEGKILLQAQAFRGCPVGDIVAAGTLKEAMRIIEVATEAQPNARRAMRSLKARAGGLARARAKRHN